MAGMSSDLDVLKDIPGYKAILKSVLKSQIQLLIEQLSDHTGEETIILTASIHDGALSHLGSNTGKGFLEGRDEIKSQFLAFCLKSHHKRKSSDARVSPYQRPQSGGQGERLTPSQGLTHKRPRLQPVSLQRAGAGDGQGNTFTPPDIHRAPSQTYSANGQDNSTSVNVKLETGEQSSSSTDSSNFPAASVSFPASLQLSHTQTSVEQGTSDTSEVQNEDDFTEQTSENDDSTATSIKIEPITENEMELEITGLEPGKTSVLNDSWGQGQMPGTSGAIEGDPNETGDPSGYNVYLNSDFYSTPSNKVYQDMYQEYSGTSREAISNQSKINQEISEMLNQSSKSEQKVGTSPYSSGTVTLTGRRRSEKKYNFMCPFCDKTWSNNYKLQRHVLTHTGEKPFQCNVCLRRFTQKSHMENHKVTHSVSVGEIDLTEQLDASL